MAGPFTLGFDLGGTRLKSVRLDASGAVERFDVRPSRAERGPEAALAALVEARSALCAVNETPRAIGLGLPGVIDPATGTLTGATPHMPGWHDTPVRETVSARLGQAVAVDNDANCAALAEARLGAARGAAVAVVVCIGTGVGAGIVIDGRLFHGAWGGAGEIGHLPLVPGRRACSCGVVGCMEAEMSGGGLTRIAQKERLPWTDAAAAFRAADEGEPGALRIVERICDRLGMAIGAAVQLLNPDVVVLGGGVANAGPRLVDGVAAALERYGLASNRTRLQVKLAELSERGGAIGAALLAEDAAGSGADGASGAPGVSRSGAAAPPASPVTSPTRSAPSPDRP